MIKLWKQKGVLNYILYPVSVIWKYVTINRIKKTGFIADATIICIGNITVGGAGKTPFTIFLANLLTENNIKFAILTRGYKSKMCKTLMVDINKHNATLVGDEALLLAKVAPTVMAKNKKDGVKFLTNKGFRVIMMDDGMQNPSVFKDISFFIFDSSCPLGNNLIIPAGPLREPFEHAVNRADVVVTVGKTNVILKNMVEKLNKKYIEAKIQSIDNDLTINKDQKYLAFAGIGNPDKFFTTLKDYGYDVKITKKYKDHYNYDKKDIEKLIKLSKDKNLQLITTSKDYVKIDQKYHKDIYEFKISLNIKDYDRQFIFNKILEKLDFKNI